MKELKATKILEELRDGRIETFFYDFKDIENLKGEEIDEYFRDAFAELEQLQSKLQSKLQAKDQEIARLNTVLINKGVEIAELKEQLAKQSCDGCVYKPNEGEPYYGPCDTCYRWYGDYYTRNKGEQIDSDR